MDEKYTFALRRIALLGGMDDYIAVSSRELGTALEMSQQSASKRIMEHYLMCACTIRVPIRIGEHSEPTLNPTLTPVSQPINHIEVSDQ